MDYSYSKETCFPMNLYKSWKTSYLFTAYTLFS